jgi:hypothetical protein
MIMSVTTLWASVAHADKCGTKDRVELPTCVALKRASVMGGKGSLTVVNNCSYLLTVKFDKPGNDVRRDIAPGSETTVKTDPYATNTWCCPRYNKCAEPPPPPPPPPPTSCKALKSKNPQAASGLYSIDPDGNGGNPAFDAYCEMTIDGGGWTLALKADGSKQTFNYGAALWTNNATFQTNFPGLDRNEAKLQAWNSVPFTDILVGIEQPVGNLGPLQLKTQKITITRPSLFALFSPNTYVATMVGRTAWKALIATSSLQPNCNREGFNNTNPYSSVRIGIVGNDQNDCNSPDSLLGLGATKDCLAFGTQGNTSCYGGDNGDQNLVGFGVVFVR